MISSVIIPEDSDDCDNDADFVGKVEVILDDSTKIKLKFVIFPNISANCMYECYLFSLTCSKQG